MPTKITMIIGSLERGGAERQLVNLGSALCERGHSVVVYAFDGSGPLAEPLKSKGVRILDGGRRPGAKNKIQKLLIYARIFLAIWIHFLAFRPRVVHTWLPMANWIGALAAKLAFRPNVVVSYRALLAPTYETYPRHKLLDRLACALSSTIVTNSDVTASELSSLGIVTHQKIVTIPNGIDFTDFKNPVGLSASVRASLGLRPNDVVACCVANLIPYKGHKDLFEALAIARSQLSPDTWNSFRILLVGRDDGIGELLMSQVQSLSLVECVRFLGSRSDVPNLLAAADIGILASHEEGMPNAVLEMLAAGLPVIATRVGGVPSILANVDGTTLVEAKKPVEMADAIVALMRSLDVVKLSAEVRMNAVRSRYSVSAMTTAYEAIYQTG